MFYFIFIEDEYASIHLFFLLTYTGAALCEDLRKTRPNEIEGPPKVQFILFFINVDQINSRAYPLHWILL